MCWVERMPSEASKDESGEQTLNYMFLGAFLLGALLSLVYLFTFVAYIAKGGTETKNVFPLYHSVYMGTYGDPIDSQHVSLFGQTNILRQSNGDYMPVAALPLSFDNTGDRFEKNLTYFRCSDPYYLKDVNADDRLRLQRICDVQRIKQVAFYTVDSRSLSFSSSWNSFFMLFVVIWLYTSWFLLLSILPEYFAGWKSPLYVVWQVVLFVVILFSGVLRIDGDIIPRNNIFFSLVLLSLTCAQQMFAVEMKKGWDWNLDIFATILRWSTRNFYTGEVRNMDVAMHRLSRVLLEMNIFLFPTLILCLYGLTVNNLSEWVFQAMFVRSVLIVVGALLLNHRKLAPIKIMQAVLDENEDASTVRRPTLKEYVDRKFVMQDMYLLALPVFALIFETLWFQFDYVYGLSQNAGMIGFIFTYLILILTFGFLFLFGVLNVGGARWQSTALFAFFALLVITACTTCYFFFMIVFNSYYCSVNDPHKYFCGNANVAHNLNQFAYTKPVRISKTTLSDVLQEINSTLTFAIA